jgi:hypothetical protein
MALRPKQSQLLPYRTKAQVILSGRFQEGGLAVIRDGGHQTLVRLPPKLFAVLALLIQASHQAQPSLTIGFISVKELTRQLVRSLSVTSRHERHDSSKTVRYVFRLRRALGRALVKSLGRKANANKQFTGAFGAEWGKRFLESQAYVGYRLSSPPENLLLQLNDDQFVSSQSQNH